MVDFTRAIKRPFADLTKFIIGAVLSIIPVVNFLAMGYELKCAKSAMNGKYDLPEWTEWGDLFVKGLLWVVVMIIYAIPVAILVAIFAGGAFMAAGQGAEAGLAGLGIGAIVMMALVLLLMYIMPSITMTFVQNDFKFGAAFGVGEIVKKSLHADYFVTWLMVGVYSLVLMLVLSFIPIAGAAIASFATGVTSMTAFGELYPGLKAGGGAKSNAPPGSKPEVG